MKKRQMRELLSVMFKIGCIGFGGETALIPVIEEEVTQEKQLIDEDEFNKDVVVANITPGALPVEIATGIGRKVCGIPGMILAGVMMALPGAFLTVLLVSLIDRSNDVILRQILFASAGVTAYIIFMLIEYARGTYAESRKNHSAKRSLFFMLLVFFLTSGKEIYQIFGVERTPVFDISIVNILLVAFFIIFYTNGQFNRAKMVVILVISVLYGLCVGETNLLSDSRLLLVLRLIMLGLSIYGVRKSINGKIPFSWLSLRTLIRELACWAAFLLVFSIPAIILYPGIFAFLGQGLISAVMSFGGGDAYLAVADGLFVSSGMVGYNDFYSKIVVVANALPGSILCKILAGVGYVLGFRSGSTFAAGYAVALAGFVCSVAASGSTFSCVVYLYERFENLQIFQTIKKYIRPIVAGLLLSVSASMLYQNMNIAETEQWNVGWILILTAALYLLNILCRKHSRIRPFFMVLISAGIALIVCNGITLLF
ncbi:MAG: chromate transporter [Clostridiales bacterium]|nr:chromate transporter [Clostridiales bacterium]